VPAGLLPRVCSICGSLDYHRDPGRPFRFYFPIPGLLSAAAPALERLEDRAAIGAGSLDRAFECRTRSSQDGDPGKRSDTE
jgi:hypothetical protein